MGQGRFKVREAEPELHIWSLVQIQDHVAGRAAEAEQHDGRLVAGTLRMRLAVRGNLYVMTTDIRHAALSEWTKKPSARITKDPPIRRPLDS